MKRYRAFAYEQARLQARQGMLPDDALWRRLEATQSAASLLQTARAGAVRPWVETLGPHQGVHEVEALLRAHWRRYVAQIAHFTPPPWQAAVHWCALWADLAILGHLRARLPTPPWARSDPLLHPLAVEVPEARERAWQEEPFRHFRPGRDPLESWLARWRVLRPPRETVEAWSPPFLRFLTLLSPQTSGDDRVRAESALRHAFHRHAFTPGAIFIHLLLVLLFLERLRGALSRGILFARGGEERE